MTDVCDEDTRGSGGRSGPAGQAGRAGRPGRVGRLLTGGPYAEIFRIPGAWRFSAAGLIGRMQMSMYGLGTVLFIAAGTGHYGIAGAVASAGSLGTAFCAPPLARLSDRRRPPAVLGPLG